MPEILISRAGKKKRIELDQKAYNIITTRKIFWGDEATVQLGKYIFRLREIEPWPPPPTPVNEKLL